MGAYRSEADARAGIERSKAKPGFAQFPDDFEIQAYELGVELWPDGFSVDEEVFSDDELPEKPPKRANEASETYFSRAPSGTSSRNPARTGAPSGSEAASNMPFDSRPRILRGARLATITILRPMSFSGS